MDLSHIEKGLGEKFIGLLGTDVVGKFLTTIDYHNRIVSFLRPGGEKPEFMKKPPDVVIPFEMTLHLVIVDAALPGGARAKIALDSGAGAGLISPEALNKVSSALVKDGRQDTLMGAGGSMKVIETKFLEGLSVGGISRDDYPMAVSDISHINTLSGENVHIDGLLGLNFFSDYRITLDYKKHKISYLGAMDQSEIVKWYQKASIFILPSFWEAFPVVILEALSCETPVITTPVGENSEVVRNFENGILVPVNNPLRLAEAINFMLDNKDKRTEMGRKGRELVIKKFSVEIVAKRLNKIYQEMISQ